MEDGDIKRIIKEVSSSMDERGYDSKAQIIGFLISNDLGYIPEFDDNRNKMAMLDRKMLLEKMLSEYLK